MKHTMFNSLSLTIVVLGMGLSACNRDEPGPTNSPPPQLPPSNNVTSAPQSGDQLPATVTPPVKETSVHPAPPSAATSPASVPPSANDIRIPSTPTQPRDPLVAEFSGLSAPKPAVWIWHPPVKRFSVAEYAVPGQDGFDQASIDVFQAGGSIDDNIRRWQTQFRNSDGSPVEPKIEELEADDMPIVLVEFAGEYKGQGAVAFTPNQLFLTAIVQAPAGQLFIRFVGPAGTVEPNRQAFMEMIRNLRRVEPQK